MGEKMKMKRSDMVAIVNGLRAASRLSAPPPLDNRKFAYAVARNLIFLVPLVEQAAKLEQAFEEQRIELNKAHATKDAQGQPVIDKGHYVLVDVAAFTAALAPLQKEFNDDMAAEIDVELHKVAFADVPPGITGDQMASIMPLIKDPPKD